MPPAAAPQTPRNSVPVLNAGPAIRVQAAPDQRCVFLDQPIEDRRFGVFEWQKLGDGTFAPVVRVYDAHVRIAVIEKIADLSYDTIRRLIIAEFVEGSQPSPGVILVSINSLIAHLRKTKEPDFWTDIRIKKYRQAMR